MPLLATIRKSSKTAIRVEGLNNRQLSNASGLMLEVHQNYPGQIAFSINGYSKDRTRQRGEKKKEKERGNKQENGDFDYKSLRNREIRRRRRSFDDLQA
jgi:hypothetical protein